MILTGMLGQRAEKMAANYLSKKGLTLKQKNYFCRHGEIDLIMSDSDYLVFVEVRHRSSALFGGAIASVVQSKQKKLRRTAEHYLISNKMTDSPCRFDILCIDGKLSNPEINWVRNAF